MKKPELPSEKAMILETLKHVVNGLGHALGRDVEIVLHDLNDPGKSVVAIANGEITGRHVGSAIVSGPLNDVGLNKLIDQKNAASEEPATLVTGYHSRTRTGRELDSTSVFFRDQAGEAYAALCVNVDRTRLREVQSLVDDLLGEKETSAPRVETNENVSVDTLISEIIEDGIRSTGKPVSIMTKDDKMEAVRHMNGRGLFLIRASVDRVAANLAVSRFTIYNYLDELKKSTPSD
jgi:predicted transcriptional regulator YheO